MTSPHNMVDELRNIAWRPQSEQEVADEAAAQGRRPARPGEEFRLVIHRDPAGKMKLGGKGKLPGLSINDINKVHIMQLARFKRELADLVVFEANGQRCPAFRNGKPYIRDFYFFKRRDRRDHRNYGKALIDALTMAGIIVDDNDESILLDRPTLIAGDPNPRIEIYLLDTRGMTPDQVADLFRTSALEQCRRLLGRQGA